MLSEVRPGVCGWCTLAMLLKAIYSCIDGYMHALIEPVSVDRCWPLSGGEAYGADDGQRALQYEHGGTGGEAWAVLGERIPIDGEPKGDDL